MEAHARIINSINFTGVDRKFDTEAEYRLLQFAQSIVISRREETEFSLAIKKAYGASILGDRQSHDELLKTAEVAATKLKRAWSNVAQQSESLQNWLNGRLRPEYAEAFKKVVGTRKILQSRLIKEGASAQYIDWAFVELEDLYEKKKLNPSNAIIETFGMLKAIALENVKHVGSFMLSLNKAKDFEEFQKNGLYGHIFDFIAIRADKPDIFTKDETYFTGVIKFDILYEAFEQVSREAHKLVPGTHDLEFSTFDLQFTPEDVKKVK